MKSAGHIFLCGFMGSGKTTHGRKLALLLKREFYDLDQYIQERENKTISFIFKYEGESAFRELESACLDELTRNAGNLVIALGGGTVCFQNNLDLLKSRGRLIYINMSAVSLARRLERSTQKRPLLEGLKGEELIAFVQERLDVRRPFYEQADLIIDGENADLSALAGLLKESA